MGNQKTKPHKQVCVAVIGDRTGKILIARRLMAGSMGGLWEFPGGKIEANETVVECIVREIREELAVTVIVEEPLIAIEHSYEDFHLTLIAHLCSLASTSEKPIPLAASEIRWVKLTEIDRYQFPAANAQIITALRNRQVDLERLGREETKFSI